MEQYREYAKELLYYTLQWEERGRILQGDVAELAHGELAVLRFLMTEKDGANPKDLSRRFHVNTSRVAAILQSLAKKGLVLRKSVPGDRRMAQIYITDAGRQYSDMRTARFVDSSSALLEKLGKEDTEKCIYIMKRMSELLEETDL